MIYLDNGATSFPKPASVKRAMLEAMDRCANPGRGGHKPAMEAAETVYRCREEAGHFFHCPPERVVMTGSCTHGLNIAIRSLVKSGDQVVISGFEHNAVTRPLHALGAGITVAGRRLFDRNDTLEQFEKALKNVAKAAVFFCTVKERLWEQTLF
jgi:selenocysteine lyase/cysteine desulfurase